VIHLLSLHEVSLVVGVVCCQVDSDDASFVIVFYLNNYYSKDGVLRVLPNSNRPKVPNGPPNQ
jgi:hypothetical protein